MARKMRYQKLPEDFEGNFEALMSGGKVPSAEEWAVHDYEGFEGLDPGEYPGLPTLVLWAKVLDEHGEAWSEYVRWQNDFATEEGFNDSYLGSANSPDDYAEDWYVGVYGEDALGPLLAYVDWHRVAMDMQYGGDVYFSDDDGSCHVFDAH